MIQLPLSIDRDAWEGFCEMRKAYKRPFTDRAKQMILNELARIEAAGHDPNAALHQSTLHGWLDVWPAKDKQIEAKPGHAAQKQAQEWVAEQEAAKAALKPIPAEIRDKLALLRGRA